MTGQEQVDEPVVLVTVFGAFPGQPVNPTEAIADALAGEDHVVSHVLDVSYDRAVKQVDELVRMVDPGAVVAFGVSGGSTGIRLEEVARNRGGARTPDVDGDTGPIGLLDTGPPEVPSRLPLAPIADALVGAGFPLEPSDDAGDYVCNHLFRHLVTTPLLAGLPVGFVHVPDVTTATVGLDLDDVATAGRIVVDTVAAVARGDL
jgi:pyroglutamyl-peptidase